MNARTSVARELADELYAYRRSTEHIYALLSLDNERLGQWDDWSPEGIRQRLARLAGFVDRADKALAIGAAAGDDRTLLEAVSFLARSEIDLSRWVHELGWINPQIGLWSTLHELLPRLALVNVDDGERYLDKIANLAPFLDQWRGILESAAAEGRAAIASHVDGAVAILDGLLADPRACPMATRTPPTDVEGAAVQDWQRRLGEVIDARVEPALRRMRESLGQIVRPVARPDDRPGLCHLPGGVELYERLVRVGTTTDLTAAAVHRIGLEQVAIIEVELAAVAGPLVGTTDATSIYRILRDDASLRYTDPDQLVADAADALARANQVADRWFARLPVAACVATEVTTGAMAYYVPPAVDGSRSGLFCFNTSSIEGWPQFDLQSTVFHESVPGHHLQVALALEDDVHPLLSFYFVAAYAEGWGLYAERLADEMGLYSSPLDRVGMLSWQAFRACRLVVDTGLHALGWSRDEAISYLLDHSHVARDHAAAEVDRYIGIPGQALSYLIGQLEIRRLRADAEQRLGSAFDIRAFHGTVLGAGSVPLSTLARIVDEWVIAELSGQR